LAAHSLSAGATFVRPTQVMQERVTLEDSALKVMTDLQKVSGSNCARQDADG